MSPALMKMWISLASMGFMFFAIVLIYLSRYKIKKGMLKVVSAFCAYTLLLVSGFIMFLVVLSGPTVE
jgi:glucan phosphoethanolaminetransferase (alkaline phosphatase superfamily)